MGMDKFQICQPWFCKSSVDSLNSTADVTDGPSYRNVDAFLLPVGNSDASFSRSPEDRELLEQGRH